MQFVELLFLTTTYATSSEKLTTMPAVLPGEPSKNLLPYCQVITNNYYFLIQRLFNKKNILKYSKLAEYKTERSIVGDLMLTIAALLVRHEFCQFVDEANGLKYILDIMVEYPDVEKLNWQALKLLKALAGDDDVKAHILNCGSAQLIVSAINRFKVRIFATFILCSQMIKNYF